MASIAGSNDGMSGQLKGRSISIQGSSTSWSLIRVRSSTNTGITPKHHQAILTVPENPLLFNMVSSRLSLFFAVVGSAIPSFAGLALHGNIVPIPENLNSTLDVPDLKEPIRLTRRATEGIHLVNCGSNGYAYSIEIVRSFLLFLEFERPSTRETDAKNF